MVEEKTISGNSEEEIWKQLNKDLSGENLLEYHAFITQDNHELDLNIDIDMGGGFEGGYAETSLTAALPKNEEFRFAIHREHFTDEIGKFFGMQDVKVGYPDFDKKVVVKTNDEVKVKELFADETIRHTFEALKEDFTFGITTHDHKRVLEYLNESGLNDPAELRKIYSAFYTILVKLYKGDSKLTAVSSEE